MSDSHRSSHINQEIVQKARSYAVNLVKLKIVILSQLGVCFELVFEVLRTIFDHFNLTAITSSSVLGLFTTIHGIHRVRIEVITHHPLMQQKTAPNSCSLRPS